MTLGTILDEAERHRKSLLYYAPEPGDFEEQFETRNVEVEYRQLPTSVPESFVAIREDGRIRGVVSLETLREYIRQPRRRRRDRSDRSTAYRTVVELLDDTVFASLTRRQLLLTAREFEDRAWRVGHGTFHVGFQSADRFRPQRLLYRRLAEETDLDVHVYAIPDDEFTPPPGVTLHTEPADEIGRYWFMVFDGGERSEQPFALVAEQRSDDEFYGVWTYDRSLVERALANVPREDAPSGGHARTPEESEGESDNRP